MPFPVSLVTPEAILFEGEASIVIARGVDGELGIQANHAPIIVALDIGQLFIREADGGQVRAAVHYVVRRRTHRPLSEDIRVVNDILRRLGRADLIVYRTHEPA